MTEQETKDFTITLRCALQAWHLPEPLTVRRLKSGFTADAWYVEAAGERFVAKYAYQSQATFEDGLRAAELVERHGIASGAPVYIAEGKRTVLRSSRALVSPWTVLQQRRERVQIPRH